MDFLYLVALISNILFCSCQSSTLVVNVVEITSTGSFTFVCNVSSTANITRWTYLAGPTETSLMSYQNGTCTVSPPDSFLSDSTMYSYTCNSTVYQVTILHAQSDIYNHILACRDALQPDGIGCNWISKYLRRETCSYCEPTMSFNVQDITEGDNVTFICRVSSDVAFVNWDIIGSTSASMGVLNGQCATQYTTFLDDSNKYVYTCNKTVYQVTRLNVKRSEHNDMYMCTRAFQIEGSGSNWIIKVKAPVNSVSMAPSNSLVNVKEGTAVEFSCSTSTARPAASVYWFRHTNGTYTDYARITENITTTTDYNDLSVTTSILRFVPTQQDNNTNIFCKANNSINTTPAKPYQKRLLNVLYKADDPYILQGNEYRVIENTSGTLSCTVKGGNPTPTLSWSCNKFSPTYQTTFNSNGNVTTTLTWNVSRTNEGTCTCTSKQTNFTTDRVYVSVVIEYEVSIRSFSINGLRDKIVTGDKGTAVIVKCFTEGNPPPAMTLTNGIYVLVSSTSSKLEYKISNVSCQDIGTYSCSARNDHNVHPVVSSIDFLVNCSPRPIEDIDETILSGIGMTVEIIIEVIAYPTPSFMWWSQVNDQWKMIQTTDRRLINSSGLQSSLTISNIDEDDFTSYKVVAVNSVGNMEHIFKLRDGSPHMPTQLRYFEALSTSSSIQLAWTPGYNGGSTQIFYIKYKSTGESSWKYQTVSDDLEQTRIFTLTNLKDNMYYYIIVLASNQYGNSSESPLLIANTKDIEKTESSNLGLMIGGIVGGLIVVAGIVITVCILIRRKKSNKEDTKQPSTCQTESTTEIKNEPQTNTQYDDIEKDNEYEMINQDSSPSMPYSVLQENDNMTQAESNRENTYENTL